MREKIICKYCEVSPYSPGNHHATDCPRFREEGNALIFSKRIERAYCDIIEREVDILFNGGESKVACRYFCKGAFLRKWGECLQNSTPLFKKFCHFV